MAEKLGFSSPDRMLARLSNKELQGWVAYYTVSPLSRQGMDMPLAGTSMPVRQTKEEQKAVVARIQKASAKQRKAR